MTSIKTDQVLSSGGDEHDSCVTYLCALTFTFTLTNTGSLAGTEAPQLYLSPPSSASSPPFLLKGFDSVFLGAGQSTTVTFELSRYSFAVWDVVKQSWEIPAGVTGVSVGASSRDLRLKGSVTN